MIHPAVTSATPGHTHGGRVRFDSSGADEETDDSEFFHRIILHTNGDTQTKTNPAIPQNTGQEKGA